MPTNKYENIPMIWRRLIASPIDFWSSIEDRNDLANDLPAAIRYQGMMVFVESEPRYYYFRDGVADGDLIPFDPADASITGNPVATYINLHSVTAGVPLEIQHQLSTEYVAVEFTVDGEAAILDWKLGKDDDTDIPNYITINSTIDTTVRVFIIGAIAVPSGPAPGNLADILNDLQNRMLSSNLQYDTMQEVADELVNFDGRLDALELVVGNQNLTIRKDEYTRTPSEISSGTSPEDIINSRPIFTRGESELLMILIDDEVYMFLASFGTYGTGGTAITSNDILQLNAPPVAAIPASDPYKILSFIVSAAFVELTSGTLVVGQDYLIDSVEVGDDFSNVGYVSDGVPFTATGTTPTSWINSTYVFDIVASQPNVEEITNELGATMTYINDYYDGGSVNASSAVFTENRTFASVDSITWNTTQKVSGNFNNTPRLIEIRVYD